MIMAMFWIAVFMCMAPSIIGFLGIFIPAFRVPAKPVITNPNYEQPAGSYEDTFEGEINA